MWFARLYLGSLWSWPRSTTWYGGKSFTGCLSCKSWHSSSIVFEKDEKGTYESMIVYDTACHEDRKQPLPLHLPITITPVNSLPLQRFPA